VSRFSGDKTIKWVVRCVRSILRNTEKLAPLCAAFILCATSASAQHVADTPGVWVGSAMIDQVGLLETKRGPDYPALPKTRDGSTDEVLSRIETTVDTTDGVVVTSRSYEVTFNDDNHILLERAGYVDADVAVSRDDVSLQNPQDYRLIATDVLHMLHGGTGYTSAPEIRFTGAGGAGATGTATLNGHVKSIRSHEMRDVFAKVPGVVFVGDGAGAVAHAVLDKNNKLIDIIVDIPGSGYTSPPQIKLRKGNALIPARATLEFLASVDSVRLTAPGSDFSAAPQIEFVGGGGHGAKAVAFVTPLGAVTGVQAIDRTPLDPTDGRATMRRKDDTQDTTQLALQLKPSTKPVRLTLTRHSVAPADTPDSSTQTEVSSYTSVVTLGGQSHVRTRRVHSGSQDVTDAFPVRLILHVSDGAETTLLQQVFLGQHQETHFAATSEAAIRGNVPADEKTGEQIVGRVTSATFPRKFANTQQGSMRQKLTFEVALGHDTDSNPFYHRYHPDHDNWDARYERKLDAGVESYHIVRDITLEYEDDMGIPDDAHLPGLDAIAGFYTEKITGLRNEPILMSGRFIIHRVSDAKTLIKP
jgi:hypothetical protein